jgi:isoleucyl-tRNA synthetase
VAVSKLLAPFCPFIADEIYDNLDGTMQSVHLCDFPRIGDRAVGARLTRDEELERAMALARETVRLGLGARGKSKIKVRQPLGEAVVVAAGREREAIERMADIVREELNVKRVRFVAAAEELGSYEVKANYRKLGPIFGKSMPLAADAIAALDPARVAAAVRAAGDEDSQRGEAALAGGEPSESGEADGSDGVDTGIGITVDGREHILTADDVILTMRAPEGYSVEREGAHAVALEEAIDEELREEGYAREIVHAVQGARKAAGLQVEDRIELALDGDEALARAARTHRDYVAGETLAVALQIEDDAGAAASENDYSQQLQIEGLALSIKLRPAVAA